MNETELVSDLLSSKIPHIKLLEHTVSSQSSVINTSNLRRRAGLHPPTIRPVHEHHPCLLDIRLPVTAVGLHRILHHFIRRRPRHVQEYGPEKSNVNEIIPV